MPFITEEDLKKRDKVIKEYLKNRRILKSRLLQENLGDQHLQFVAEKVYKPITQTIEESQRQTDAKQDQLIEKLQESQNLMLEQLPHPPAIEAPKKTIHTIDFEKKFNEDEKHLLNEQGFNPNINNLAEQGVATINKLIEETRRKNQELGGAARRKGIDKTQNKKYVDVNRKYRKTLEKLLVGLEFVKTGSGMSQDPNKLCERLHLLISTKLAGNNNQRINKEIASILNKLNIGSHISDCDYKKLYTKIL